jgi:integrase
VQSASRVRRQRIGDNLYEENGNYLVIVRVNGRQYSRALQAINRTDAKRKAPAVIAALRNKIENGKVVVPDSQVALGALADSYLNYQEGPSGKLAASTLELHRTLLMTKVLPHFERDTQANEIRAAHVRRFIESLIDAEYSGSYVRSCVGALTKVLDYGVRNELLEENVVRKLVPDDLPDRSRETEPRYLGVEEVTRLFGSLSEEFRPVAVTLFYAGLRVSEALALRWRDIDFENALIRVPGTKTVASAAPVPLLPQLAMALREHRERQGTFGFHRITSDAHVFVARTGQVPDRRNVTRAVNNASVKAGLVEEGQELVGPHDLRHSCAAYARELGLRREQISRFLRHANVTVTETIYGGLLGTKEEQARDIALAFAGGASS